MDSSDPFASSQSFIDLLNTQNPLNTAGTNNDETLSPPIQTISPNRREPRSRWTLPEEQVLVSAWLNTSKDPIVGNEQKGVAFWQRVADYYAASPTVSNLPLRGTNTCKQKWAKINEKVSKFSGCYEYASRQYRSGETEDDVLELANKLYFQDQKVKFTLEHAWRLLRTDQKWCTLVSSKSSTKSKKVKSNDGVAYSSTSNTASHVEEETMERPIGVKASKAKGKKRVKTSEESEANSLKDIQELWVLKEQDLTVRERLSKQKLLDSLISKAEPLSEMELSLKNKLIKEML